jgi:hypothetical protein
MKGPEKARALVATAVRLTKVRRETDDELVFITIMQVVPLPAEAQAESLVWRLQVD